MTNNPVSQELSEEVRRLVECAAKGDNLDAVANAILALPTAPQSRDGLVERATEKLTLWFFRDCNTGTRRCLFSLFGLPLDEITNQGTERHALKYILRHLRTASGEATEPSAPLSDERVARAAVDQNDAMRQELAYVGSLISDLARVMMVDQANDDGSWPDLSGRIRKLIDATLARAALSASIPSTAPVTCSVCGIANRGHYIHAAPFTENYHEFTTTAQGEVVQAEDEFAAWIVREACETDRADPDCGDTICIATVELDLIARQAFRDHRLAFSHSGEVAWPAAPYMVDCDPVAVASVMIKTGCDNAPYSEFDGDGTPPKSLFAFWDAVKEEADRIAGWAIQGLGITSRAALSTPEAVSLKGDRV